MSADGAAGLQLVRLPMAGPDAPADVVPTLAYAPVVAHTRVAQEYWLIALRAPDIARTAQPGQFVMMTVAREGELAPVLPRPMALYGWDRDAGSVEVLYRVVGEGTRTLSTWRPGEVMVVVGPLGRGFVLRAQTQTVLLLGRGIGTCSLTALAEEAANRGMQVHALVSARNRDALIGSDVYRRVGAKTVLEVVDTDGSSSVEWVRPRLTGVLDEAAAAQVFVCGSNRLLHLGAELARPLGAGVQVSLEAHMACGLGYCHGCSTGYPGLGEESPLVCTDGPVFAWTERRR